jgi:hypothetical protein
MKMSLDLYRKKLLLLWCIGFLVPFILLLVQFGNGKYGNKSLEVLGWLTSLTLSTVLLMVGVMVSNPVMPTDQDDDEKPPEDLDPDERSRARARKAKADHERFVFYFAAGVSLIYLLIINLVFFLEPLASEKPQELMRDYKIFLAVFDSVISLLIGYFFGKS